MSRTLLKSNILCVALLLAGAVCLRAQAPDLILSNGHIFTGDPAKPWVEATSIRGTTVLATGANAAITSTAGKHTQVIDLQGRMAMPGINDAHDHVGGAHYGVEAVTRHPPQDHPSIDDLADAVRAAAATAPPGVWIHALIGSPVITSPRLTRAAIDEAGGDHPVILQSYVGHGAILNTLGLAKVGIDDSIKDPRAAIMIATPRATSLVYWKNMPAVRFGNGSAIKPASPRRLRNFVSTLNAGWSRVSPPSRSWQQISG
jgi:predicted amidohydrolase YtcJ